MGIPVTVFRGLVIALLAVVALAAAPSAYAAPKAALVMDMRNGKVIYARRADQRLHPASLTKMMTLYLTFEAVRDGRLRLNQKLRVSRHASRQPASKLYLKSGQRVTVRSLIRATALKSANDAAMVLAEGIGGSQRGFARMMTRKAKYLGMKNTAFRNPHGLTSSGHYSTARDMAILGRHLFHDYPEYYNIFKRKSDFAAGKRVWNTNRMLRSYHGADGIKTGYTRAAGYNLVASARRGSKHILAVQFGANSSADRTRRVTRLLDIGFSKAPRKARKVKPQVRRAAAKGRPPAWSPLPLRKPGRGDTRIAALGKILVPQAAAAVPPQGNSRYAAPVIADLPIPRGGAKSASTGSAVDAAGGVQRSPLPPRKPADRVAQSSRNWTAEVGPYSTEERALADLVGITNKPLVARVKPSFRVSRSIGRVGKQIYKLRMSGLSQGSAHQICGELLQRSLICRVVATPR
ncbi:MAG: D-alanyl-D-alanine carboxypeptidase family protein [Pseudomonadota bacterium]